MTFIRLQRYTIALVGGAVLLALGATSQGHCQRPKKMDVELNLMDASKGVWQVTTKDDEFILRRFHSEDHSASLHNFRESADWMEISGWNMGYDLKGKSKDVVAQRRYGKSTQWEKKKAEQRLHVRLRVLNGSLKGWWAGVKVVRQKAEPGKPALARLILVKDEKDAAVFFWEDPDDAGS